MTALNVLAKARALLVKRGWVQGLAIDEMGRLCTVGACKIAAGGGANDVRWPVAAAAAAAVLERSLDLDEEVSEWNDRTERTLDEVLAAFDRAIASLEAAK